MQSCAAMLPDAGSKSCMYRCIYTTEASAASLSSDLLLGMLVGEVMFGTDSHTCNAGAFGQFASGIGNTDAGFILGTGKLLIKVPPSIRFVLDGEMPPYLLAKDIILQIIGEITVAGNCYHAWRQPAHMQANSSYTLPLHSENYAQT